MNSNLNKMLGIVTAVVVAGCMITATVMIAIEGTPKKDRELFDQGAIQGASVILQSQQQGVTNMDLRVFLDSAWWLHTNKVQK